MCQSDDTLTPWWHLHGHWHNLDTTAGDHWQQWQVDDRNGNSDLEFMIYDPTGCSGTTNGYAASQSISWRAFPG